MTSRLPSLHGRLTSPTHAIALWGASVGLVFLLVGWSTAVMAEAQSGTSVTETEADVEPTGELDDLAEIDRQLNNPLTSLWSLTLQENYLLLDGNQFADSEYANNFFFQPALPIPVGEDKVFIGRPVFPLVTNPVQQPDGSVDHTTGLGDIQLFTSVGPRKIDGTVWGVGATFIFPTASDDALGAGKYQVGPAILFFYLGKTWTLGTLTQHWWSVGSDSHRPSTNHTDIQYVIRRRIPGAMSIGMGPTISIDWEAASDNRVTLPIGLGITKTVRWGKLPVKLRFEPQYSIIRPDDLGTEWNIRLQISPVIPSPF